MTAIEETKMTTMLAGESTPIFDALCEQFGAPATYARKAAEEYDLERQVSEQGKMPRPKPPAGKNGVAYSTRSSK